MALEQYTINPLVDNWSITRQHIATCIGIFEAVDTFHSWVSGTTGEVYVKKWDQLLYISGAFQRHYANNLEFEATDMCLLCNKKETAFGKTYVAKHRNERPDFLQLTNWIG